MTFSRLLGISEVLTFDLLICVDKTLKRNKKLTTSIIFKIQLLDSFQQSSKTSLEHIYITGLPANCWLGGSMIVWWITWHGYLTVKCRSVFNIMCGIFFSCKYMRVMSEAQRSCFKMLHCVGNTQSDWSKS